MESLPFSQITGLNVEVVQTVAIIVSVTLLFVFIRSGYSRNLIALLAAVFSLAISFSLSSLANRSKGLVVFNKPAFSDIGYYAYNKRYYSAVPKNGFIPHRKAVLRLSDNWMRGLESDETLKVDVLVLSGEELFSISQLQRWFNPDIVVFDSSIPIRNRQKMMTACAEVGIKAHDVSQKGAYFVTF